MLILWSKTKKLEISNDAQKREEILYKAYKIIIKTSDYEQSQ